MNQTAKCPSCKSTFDTPGVPVGKTSAVVCPKCRKVVVVRGKIDEADTGPTVPVSKLAVEEDDSPSHSWRKREHEHAGSQRLEPIEAAAPRAGRAPAEHPLLRILGASALMMVCVAFLLARVFSQPTGLLEDRARMQAARSAFQGVTQVVEGGVPTAVMTDAGAAALKGIPPQQICLNATYSGLFSMRIRTQSGTMVADCTRADKPPAK